MYRLGVDLERAVELMTLSVTAGEETEVLPLARLGSRVCGEDILAPMDNPPFNRSPLDGYAFFHEDSQGAGQDSPAVLEVIEEVFAGQYPSRKVVRGTATRLMTGAPIPTGADCVIRQEHTDYGMEFVQIYKELSAHENYCDQGEDVRKGATLISEGELLSFAHIGVLAEMGIEEARVYRKPRVLLITTGDELSPVHTKLLRPGMIYNSNGPMLSARMGELGVEVIDTGQLADEQDIIADCIARQVDDVDIIITTGGVSVGTKDMLQRVTRRLGAREIFWGLNMKPGSPALFCMYKDKPVLSLSGNPFAFSTTFELLARPAFAKIGRNPAMEPIHTTAVMADSFKKAAFPADSSGLSNAAARSICRRDSIPPARCSR